MGARLDSRRWHIAKRGRSMTLTRTGGASVTVRGYVREYRPEEVTGSLMAGDVRVEILNDEIVTASWPAPIAKPDRLTVDGRTLVVQGAQAIYEGSTLIGHSIWARG